MYSIDYFEFLGYKKRAVTYEEIINGSLMDFDNKQPNFYKFGRQNPRLPISWKSVGNLLRFTDDNASRRLEFVFRRYFASFY